MKRVVTIETSRDYYSIEDTANEAITIGELIDLLREYDEDEKVILKNDNGYTYGLIGRYSIELEEYKTREEEDYEMTMDDICCDLTDLEARYENPIEDDAEDEHPMTDEEYREERAEIFATYGVTEEEYNEYMRRH